MLETAAALRLLLAANSGVAALVGTRIFHGAINQTSEFPALVYRQDDETAQEILTERANGLEETMYRFFSTAKGSDGFLTAKALHRAVYMCLQGFQGLVVDLTSPMQTLFIQRIHLTASFDFFDEMSKTHQVISDYQVSAEQQRPT